MDKNILEQLILAATTQATAQNLNKLYSAMLQFKDSLKEYNEQFEQFFTAIDEEEIDAPTAKFIMAICGFNLSNSPAFRSLLTSAIKTLLPPFLNHTPIIRALGVRDNNVPPSNVVGRFRKLNAIKNGLILFLNSSARWGTITNLDSMTGTVAISQFGVTSTNSNSNVPLDLVLVSGILFKSGIDVVKIADVTNKHKLSSFEFRNIAKANSILNLHESHFIQLAKCGCAKAMTSEEFDLWWSNTAAPVKNAKRRSCDGRTMQEILILLSGESSEQELSDEEVAGFEKFFTNLKREFIVRDLKGLAELMVQLSHRANDEQLEIMLTPLLDKTPFWPADPLRASHESLSVWSELSAKDISKLAEITKKVFHGEYIAGLSMRLPLKALNSLTVFAPIEELDDIIAEQHSCSSDLTLWIWKNRKKGSEILLAHLNIDNIVRALSQEHLPKAWTASRRELHNLLMDNAEFQKYLITHCGDPLVLSAALQGALFLSSGERQSLIVKLARSSKDLQSHLEGGAGAKILKAGLSEREQQELDDANSNEPTYTSNQSHRKLQQELDDIIKIHKPENRESLKTARAHGDFRENSEFDAAKERRNFLSKRQGELERELMLIQPINLRDVEVTDVAIIGSKVTLENEDKSLESHYLLGAWDGNPEKSYLSYKTRLGNAIYHQELNAMIKKPNNSTAKIVKIEAIEEEILKDLD